MKKLLLAIMNSTPALFCTVPAVIIVLAGLLALAVGWPTPPIHAQSSGSLINAPSVINAVWQTAPGAVPTTAADLCAQTFYIVEIVLTNTNASTAVTVTVQSKTGVVLFIASIPGQSGSNNYVIAYPSGLQSPGGVTWLASGTGVNGYIKGGF